MLVRIKEAAKILGVSTVTLRKWCNEGKIPYYTNPSDHRLFNTEELQALLTTRNQEALPKPQEQGAEAKAVKIYYTRSSSKNDTLTATQKTKLEAEYGAPDKTFTDSSSGLNENRKGLKALIRYCDETPGRKIVYVTSKDRLTRFGYTYLELLFSKMDTQIIVLDDNTMITPQEELLQDFMSLLASFSGKIYRLRGWSQQKQLLEKIGGEIKKHEHSSKEKRREIQPQDL